MDLSNYLPANNLFILISVFVIALVGFLWFLRKPENRHPMEGEHARELDEERARANAEGTIDVPPTRR